MFIKSKGQYEGIKQIVRKKNNNLEYAYGAFKKDPNGIYKNITPTMLYYRYNNRKLTINNSLITSHTINRISNITDVELCNGFLYTIQDSTLNKYGVNSNTPIASISAMKDTTHLKIIEDNSRVFIVTFQEGNSRFSVYQDVGRGFTLMQDIRIFNPKGELVDVVLMDGILYYSYFHVDEYVVYERPIGGEGKVIHRIGDGLINSPKEVKILPSREHNKLYIVTFHMELYPFIITNLTVVNLIGDYRYTTRLFSHKMKTRDKGQFLISDTPRVDLGFNDNRIEVIQTIDGFAEVVNGIVYLTEGGAIKEVLSNIIVNSELKSFLPFEDNFGMELIFNGRQGISLTKAYNDKTMAVVVVLFQKMGNNFFKYDIVGDSYEHKDNLNGLGIADSHIFKDYVNI